MIKNVIDTHTIPNTKSLMIAT